jgi:transcriptional regulator with XRE-family HTH domain
MKNGVNGHIKRNVSQISAKMLVASMKARGLSKEDAIDLLGITDRAYAHWDTGRVVRVSREVRDRLANAAPDLVAELEGKTEHRLALPPVAAEAPRPRRRRRDRGKKHIPTPRADQSMPDYISDIVDTELAALSGQLKETVRSACRSYLRAFAGVK